MRIVTMEESEEKLISGTSASPYDERYGEDLHHELAYQIAAHAADDGEHRGLGEEKGAHVGRREP